MSKNLIKLAEEFEKKHLTKTTTSTQDLKKIIVDHANSSAEYIPLVDGKSFVNALIAFNRNALLRIEYDTAWYDILSSPEIKVSNFSFEEGTPIEVINKFKFVPAGIRKFLSLNKNSFKLSTGKWDILFP